MVNGVPDMGAPGSEVLYHVLMNWVMAQPDDFPIILKIKHLSGFKLGAWAAREIKCTTKQLYKYHNVFFI